jgi:hypothetical protein
MGFGKKLILKSEAEYLLNEVALTYTLIKSETEHPK